MFIEVSLSRLPTDIILTALPILSAELSASAAPSRVISVQTGLIPVLVIGSVYHDGHYVGLLSTETEDLDLNRQDWSTDLAPIFESVSGPGFLPSHGIREGQVLPRDRYRLTGFNDSYCLRIASRKDGAEFLIPCGEVFRTFYAPHRSIALAFTNGPWQSTYRQVVHDEPDRPTFASDGTWNISLANGVGPEHAAVVGNLVLNPFGRKAADSIWPPSVTPSSFVRRSVRSGDRAVYSLPGRLKAPLPFDWDNLPLRIRCFTLQIEPRISLVVQIVAFGWPLPPKGPPGIINWRPWRDTTQGEERQTVDEPPPFSGFSEDAESSEDLPIRSDLDPSSGSSAILVEAFGARQLNPPRLERISKESSQVYDGVRGRRVKTSVDSISVGNSVPGLSGAATAVTSASRESRKPASTRFTEVLRMLKALEQSGSITSFSVAEPDSDVAEHRGDVVAWRLPEPVKFSRRRSTWHLLIDDTHRSVMLCQIIAGSTIVYWGEIEAAPGEQGYRSLIFRCQTSMLLNVMPFLLRELVSHRGVWPDSKRLGVVPGLDSAQCWTHSQVGGALNAGRAMHVIRSVAGL